MPKVDPVHAAVRLRFDYDPLTGVFTDKTTGTQVAGARMPDGYLHVVFKGKSVSLHRLAFMWMLGVWPRYHVDHVNGIKSDNRWANIRQATPTQNAQNKKPFGKVNHGYKGVSIGSDGRWRAKITVDGVVKNIPGSYESAEQAHRAYKTYAGRLFGQFARTIGPVTGERPAQDNEFAADAQLDVMKKRRASIAQQLQDIDLAIEALEEQLDKRQNKRAASAARAIEIAEAMKTLGPVHSDPRDNAH